MNDDVPTRDHEGRSIDFGRRAVDYDRHRPGFPDEFFDRLLRLGWVRTGQRAVDFGTGTGTVALGLARRGVSVVGVDVSTALLDVASRRATAASVPARFVLASAEDTGLASSSYDLVTAGQCWWWFDAPRAVAEARRLLVRGGRLIICDFSYLPLPGNVAERTEELICEHNPGWPRAGWRGVHPEQVEALDRGGFEEVESFSYVVPVRFDHEAWRGRIRTCNGVGAALTDEQVDAFDADLARLLATEFPGDLLVPHRVFATSGRMP